MTTVSTTLPDIIQGGMGVGVSNWHLAKTVATHGALGVVSGTGIDTVMIRRLQTGDEGGHIRRALSHFPWPAMAERILGAFYVEGGKPADKPFRLMPMPNLPLRRDTIERIVAANFVEVFLAKEGHNGVVGINYLEKIQVPTLPSLLGAMLAGVNVVLMGAGIPMSIPGILDGLANWQQVELKVDMEGEHADGANVITFDPTEFFPEPRRTLNRPAFLAIVSSETVAKTLVRRATGKIDGFVVEGYTAGGHNAPPRKARSATGEVQAPAFGEKDKADLEAFRTLGLPFWLAGGYATPGRIDEARHEGAQGIQAGTIFAFSRESGILSNIKQQVMEEALAHRLNVYTDFRASPTGYPFKIVAVPGTVTLTGRDRPRLCDLGYLRQLYWTESNTVGYRCPGEAIDNYVAKGGSAEDTAGRQCLCNGLLATIGLGQARQDGPERPIITAGEDFAFVEALVTDAKTGYSAVDALTYLRSGLS